MFKVRLIDLEKKVDFIDAKDIVAFYRRNDKMYVIDGNDFHHKVIGDYSEDLERGLELMVKLAVEDNLINS